jgi:hypothetical protein
VFIGAELRTQMKWVMVIGAVVYAARLSLTSCTPVNVVVNYDMPDSADQYLHRVGRAGRFGTKGLAISFVSRSSSLFAVIRRPSGLCWCFD